MARQSRVPATRAPRKPKAAPAPALRVSQVTVVVGLLDEYDAPKHFLDENGRVRQFEFFGDEHGTSLEKAAGFLAAVPAMLAAPPDLPPAPAEE